MGVESTNYGLIGAFIFIFAFVVLFAYALIYSNQRRKRLLRFASQMGFTVIKKDEQLLRQLQPLYFPSRLLRISNLAKKKFQDGQIYLFDALSSDAGKSNHGEETHSSEFGNIAILSPRLNLPSFFLLAHIPGPGALMTLVENWMAETVERAGFSEVDTIPPDFSLQYRLFAKEDLRCEEVFSEKTLSAIARTGQIIARGSGNALVFNRLPISRGEKLDMNGLADHIQQAMRLFNTLQE